MLFRGEDSWAFMWQVVDDFYYMVRINSCILNMKYRLMSEPDDSVFTQWNNILNLLFMSNLLLIVTQAPATTFNHITSPNAVTFNLKSWKVILVTTVSSCSCFCLRSLPCMWLLSSSGVRNKVFVRLLNGIYCLVATATIRRFIVQLSSDENVSRI